jgi:hypothetical protein
MLLLAISASVFATSWRAPWPRMWTSDDGTYALAVTPAKSIDGKASAVKLRLFCYNYEGRELTLWRSETDFYPARVNISPDARVVALNEYPGYSQRTAVAIFDDRGKMLARHGIFSLMPKSEFDGIPGDERLKPKPWVRYAIFESVRNLVNPPPVADQPVVRSIGELQGLKNEFPSALRIETVTGRTLWFDLMTGARVGG